MGEKQIDKVADIRPVKILYLHPTFTFGGAERTSLNLLTGLNKDRFKVTLVTSREIASYFSGVQLEKVIYVEDIGMGVWFGGLYGLYNDIRIARRLMSEEKPDIAFGMMHYASTILALAKKLFRLKAKIISSPRGPSTHYLRSCFERKSDRLRLGLLFTLFCKWSDGLVVPSAGTKEDCVKNFGARAERVRVINNSIDADEVGRMSLATPDPPPLGDGMVIATAGRLSMEKNMPLLLKAFSSLRSIDRVKLLVIGDGPERGKLESLSGELGIGDDTVFVGFQENPYPYLRRADLFVHTCLVEGFGNIIVEAMACGVPVVATDCPCGPREIIRDGESGILVPMDDSEALAQTIHRLLHDRGRRELLAEQGSLRARDFSIGRMVKAYEEFFLQVQA